MGEHSIELNPNTISTNPADQTPFLLLESNQGFEIRLEDLAATPEISDWDYNDTVWFISVDEKPGTTDPEKVKKAVEPLPKFATKISGPGRFSYPPKSLAIVTDSTAAGDAADIKRVGPADIRVVDQVGGGWPQVRWELAKEPVGTIGALILSGHGDYGGVAAADAKNSLVVKTLDPATLQEIKQRLAPGAPIILAGCNCALAPTGLQSLANITGHPVIANTGELSDGNFGTGDWGRFDPKP
ncbi:DUF4347 domain-containing protein [Tuwongella immobilis]|uniref:DUF4347 domain-containing protein n=1 Tax=Tuwongella immobilis TaxID=692036 RepID=UPI0013A6A71A|nr:DUF4347 domain-containing protein [Tuwongella immobilis]